jgi:hypothetical protein
MSSQSQPMYPIKSRLQNIQSASQSGRIVKSIPQPAQGIKSIPKCVESMAATSGNSVIPAQLPPNIPMPQPDQGTNTYYSAGGDINSTPMSATPMPAAQMPPAAIPTVTTVPTQLTSPSYVELHKCSDSSLICYLGPSLGTLFPTKMDVSLSSNNPNVNVVVIGSQMTLFDANKVGSTKIVIDTYPISAPSTPPKTQQEAQQLIQQMQQQMKTIADEIKLNNFSFVIQPYTRLDILTMTNPLDGDYNVVTYKNNQSVPMTIACEISNENYIMGLNVTKIVSAPGSKPIEQFRQFGQINNNNPMYLILLLVIIALIIYFIYKKRSGSL